MQQMAGVLILAIVALFVVAVNLHARAILRPMSRSQRLACEADNEAENAIW